MSALEEVLESCAHRDTLARMDIAYATDLWLGELARQGKSARTCDTYRRVLYKLHDLHPHADVSEVTTFAVRRFVDGWNGRSEGTCAQIVTVVNTFFDWLTGEGIIKVNPTRRNGLRILSRPRLVASDENDNITTVSTDEVRRLISESLRYDDRWDEILCINVLAYMGPRRTALANARISDYDQVERTLRFKEKGGKWIEKPCPDELAALIERAIYSGVYESADDYLIPGRAEQRRNGERDSRVIWRIVKDVAERANVTTHVHALRAAFAVHFLEANPGQVVGLQALMGHRRIETTQVYLRRLNRSKAMEPVRTMTWGEQ